MRRRTVLFALLAVAVLAFFAADMLVGSARYAPAQVWEALCGRGEASAVFVVRQIRLVKALVALLAGAALSVSGLQMQTLFRNPLAGPYVLGITSGASLGVALLIIAAPLFHAGASVLSAFGMAGAAWAGAALALALMAAVGSRIKDIMVLLILGMMLSSGVGAVVQVLQYLSHEDALKAYVVWTMGSLGDVTLTQLWLFAPAVLAGLLTAVAAIKPLNMLLLGEQYAVSMGLSLHRARALIFLSTTLLAGTVTAFCGPIGFIGLAVPHIARFLMADSDNRVLMPATMLTGMALMLLCDIASKWLVLPVNSVTAILGIPIVVWIVLRIGKR